MVSSSLQGKKSPYVVNTDISRVFPDEDFEEVVDKEGYEEDVPEHLRLQGESIHWSEKRIRRVLENNLGIIFQSSP